MSGAALRRACARLLVQCTLPWALAAGAAGGFAEASPADERSLGGVVRVVRVELVGPLDSAQLATSVGQLDVERRLSAGETLTAWVPVPAESADGARAARWRVAGPRDAGGLLLGRARTVSVLEPHPAYAELDPALVARALPQVAPSATLGAAVLALALFAAILALACAARARPLFAALALLTGAGGAGLAWSLRGATAPVEAIVLEALDEAPVWLLRRAGHARLELSDIAGPLSVRAPEGPGPLRAWSDGEHQHLQARGALVAETPWVATVSRLDPGKNEFEPLSLVHRRSAGAWSMHGDWDLGAPLPPPRLGEAPSVPPWLMAGLPAGLEVWLARRADGSWLRWVGRGG